MKILVKQFATISLFLIVIIFIGCGQKEADKPFGNTVVYIPQSTTTGGVNLNYLVPSVNSLDSNTNNFRVDTLGNKVNVFLGVTCSGKQQALNGYTATAYTLPTNVAVPSGAYAAGFYLTINTTTLKTYAGKKVALCVVISNPTNYTLSTVNQQVIIIIDVDSLKLP